METQRIVSATASDSLHNYGSVAIVEEIQEPSVVWVTVSIGDNGAVLTATEAVQLGQRLILASRGKLSEVQDFVSAS